MALLEEPSRIEVLSAAGGRAPLFIFPGMGGELDIFEPFKASWGGERPLYALRLIGSLGECEPVRDVRRLAALYAADVRNRQGRGPYYLAGFSFGAIAAFEVARELQAQGEQVALVTMIDCPAPGYPKLPPAIVRLHEHAKNFLALSPRERVRYLAARVAHRFKVARELAGARELSVDRPEMSPTLRRAVSAIDEIYVRYVPAPLGVDVLFLSAASPPDWPATSYDDPLMGWGPALRGRIMQARTPGNHLEIFRPGNVDVLADRLRVAIAETEGSAAAPAREAKFSPPMVQA